MKYINNFFSLKYSLLFFVELIKTFLNISQASKDTNIPVSTISYHILNRKPKHKFQQYYFKKLINNNKCEETIENLVGE